MNYKRMLCIFLCVILHVSMLTCFAVEENGTNLDIVSGTHSVDASHAVLGDNKLVDNLQAAFVFETNSETLMYAWNPDQQLYPASFVKIMTAFLVVEQGNLDDIVTVDADVINSLPYDAISVDLAEGEILSVRELLYCMMVQSANDAAAVLAEYISGSQANFVALMNEKAAELGCTGTKYMNVHGLHHNEQVSTARDTCRILQAALKNQIFRDIFCTVWHTVEQTNKHAARYLSSNNFLMNTDDVGIYYDGRVKGGRTGVTTNDDRCVASISKSGNMELICVVMGSKSSYASDGYWVDKFGGFPETTKLLDIAYNGYARKQIVFADQILRQQTVMNGESDVFIASKEDFSTVLPADISFEHLQYRYTDVPGSDSAPIIKGQNMASLQIWYDSICVAETDVYAMNDVPVTFQKIAVQNETGNSASVLGVIIIIILVLIAVFACCIIGLRLYSRHKRHSDSKKHRGR